VSTPSLERITCYIGVGDAGGGWIWMEQRTGDVPAVLTVRCKYQLVNTATGRTVRYYRHNEFVPPKNEFQFNPGEWHYSGAYELAGAVRLAIAEQIKGYYETVYPDMVFVWYP
jgi:hypothetical protein